MEDNGAEMFTIENVEKTCFSITSFENPKQLNYLSVQCRKNYNDFGSTQ